MAQSVKADFRPRRDQGPHVVSLETGLRFPTCKQLAEPSGDAFAVAPRHMLNGEGDGVKSGVFNADDC